MVVPKCTNWFPVAQLNPAQPSTLGPKYANDAFSKKEQDVSRSFCRVPRERKLTFLFAQGAFLEDFVDEGDSPGNAKATDVEDVLGFEQMNSRSNSPADPFSQGLENLPCQSA